MARIPVSDRTPRLVDPIEGRMLVDAAGREVVKVSNVPAVPSPFGITIGGAAFRAIVVLTGGQHELLFIRNEDAVITPLSGTELLDDDAFNAGVDAAVLAGATARR